MKRIKNKEEKEKQKTKKQKRKKKRKNKKEHEIVRRTTNLGMGGWKTIGQFARTARDECTGYISRVHDNAIPYSPEPPSQRDQLESLSISLGHLLAHFLFSHHQHKSYPQDKGSIPAARDTTNRSACCRCSRPGTW